MMGGIDVSKRLAAALVALCLTIGLPGTASGAGASAPPVSGAGAGHAPQFNPPKGYYLALGDSIPHGHMFVDGVPTRTSYVYRLGERLRAIRPDLTVVNFGCSGESTATFLHGGCPMAVLGLPLQDPFEGPQLDAAVAFLHQHPGDVSPITITLGGGDLRELLQACNYDFACIGPRVPAAIATFTANLAAILDRLRAEAPDAEIIVTGMWNSSTDGFDVGDPLIMQTNRAMATVVAGQRARFADPFPVFNPQGDPAAELAAICHLTLLCTDGDTHPSAAGHEALAGLVFAASGYGRLGQ